MAVPVNVVFQGGGAKLVTLIGAVKALQASSDIEIQAVAGTSAGSIAAAMVAFRFDITKTVERVRSASPMIAAMSSKTGTDTWFDKGVLAWKALRGRPLIDEKALRDLVKLILSDARVLRPSETAPAADVTQIRLDQASMPLHILTTDFINSEPFIFDTSNGSTLVDAIMHSCAIPIVVRTFRHLGFNQQYIDGGICDNLPSSAIFKNNYPTIGFSFGREPAKDQGGWGIRSYCQNMLSVAMARSVQRTVESLSAANVCILPEEVNWLDFKGAVARLDNSDNLDSVVRDAETWLAKWVNRRREIEKSVVSIDHPKVHADLARTLESAYETDEPFSRLVCDDMLCSQTARSLAQKGANDESTLYSTFSVDGAPVTWMRIWDMSYLGSPVDHEGVLEIVDRNGDPVLPTHFVVQKDAVPEGIERTIFLYFNPPLTTASSPYRLMHRIEQKDSLAEVFGKKRADYVSISPSSYRSVKNLVVLVHCPKDLKASQRDLAEASDFPREQREVLPSITCNENEVKEYCAKYQIQKPNGYVTLGRRGSDLKRDEGIGVVIQGIGV